MIICISSEHCGCVQQVTEPGPEMGQQGVHNQETSNGWGNGGSEPILSIKSSEKVAQRVS